MKATLAGLAFALVLVASAHAQTTDIKIGGSGGPTVSLGPVTAAFHERHPDVHAVLLPTLGSQGGIRAAAQGSIDIGISGRELKAEERASGVVQIEFARTPFVFATASSTKATGVTLQDLVRIYDGTLTHWPDGSRLRLVLRPPGDSDNQVLRAHSDELRKASIAAESRPGMVVAITDLDSVEQIEKIPGAFGTTTLGQMLSEQRSLRPLSLDGVTPSVANAMNGTYRMHKRLFMVIRPDAGPAVRKFVTFVQSPPAQEILKRNGHWIPATVK